MKIKNKKIYFANHSGEIIIEATYTGIRAELADMEKIANYLKDYFLGLKDLTMYKSDKGLTVKLTIEQSCKSSLTRMTEPPENIDEIRAIGYVKPDEIFDQIKGLFAS